MESDLYPEQVRFQEPSLFGSLKDRLIYGAKWALLGAAIAQGSGLVASYLLAWFLGKVGFGEYAIVQSSIGMFGILAGMAMGITTTKHVAEWRTIDPSRAGRFIGIPSVIAVFSSGIISVVFFIFAGPIAVHVLGEPKLAEILKIGMPLLIFSAIGGVQAGGLAGLESFKRMAGCNAIIGVLRLPCLALGVWLWGLKGAILGLVISQAASCMIYGICLRADCRKRGIKISYRGFRTEKYTLLRFSIPTLMAGLTIGPVDWLCNVLLVRQPGGYAQMGIYNATVQWQSAVKFVPLKILDVTLPVLSNLYGSGETRKYYRVLKSSLFVTALSGCFIGLPIVILSRYIMAGYGEGFAEGYPVLVIMIAASIMYMTARVLVQVAQSRGKALWDFIFCSIYSGVLITSWLMLLKRGAAGLAGAVLIGYFVITCLLAIYVLREAVKDLGKSSKEG